MTSTNELRGAKAVGKAGIVTRDRSGARIRELNVGGVLAISLLLATLLVIAVGLLAAAAVSSAHYRKHGDALLNDLDVTPGMVRTTDLKIVCGTTTKQFRKTTESMKKEVYAQYGVQEHVLLPGTKIAPEDAKHPLYEIDHLISLELGGADDVKNLWPQPYYEHPGAHEKDELENWLHEQVCPPSPECKKCTGSMGLAGAQAKIAKDWFAFYGEMKRLPVGTSGAGNSTERASSDAQ